MGLPAAYHTTDSLNYNSITRVFTSTQLECTVLPSRRVLSVHSICQMAKFTRLAHGWHYIRLLTSRTDLYHVTYSHIKLCSHSL